MENSESGPIHTPRYLRTITAADDLARRMGHSHAGVEHLFLALLRDKDGLPTQVLSTKIDLDDLDAEIVALMTSAEYLGSSDDETEP
ncbi:Clp protease N-terminal domain-containing protein [Actinomadura sp. 9N215]|uniref:Clp protease N-terminal domain-containing protein n=1 Tax=Actinomadura sp. 9N215 TaxID=3375150 RepID=UPI0037B04772